MTLVSKTNDLRVNHDSTPRKGIQNRPFLPMPSRLSLERDRDKNLNLLSEESQREIFLGSNADPLSVLAYAGRIVDRENRWFSQDGVVIIKPRVVSHFAILASIFAPDILLNPQIGLVVSFFQRFTNIV